MIISWYLSESFSFKNFPYTIVSVHDHLWLYVLRSNYSIFDSKIFYLKLYSHRTQCCLFAHAYINDIQAIPHTSELIVHANETNMFFSGTRNQVLKMRRTPTSRTFPCGEVIAQLLQPICKRNDTNITLKFKGSLAAQAKYLHFLYLIQKGLVVGDAY